MDSKVKHKRKVFYRRCAAGERRAKQRILEASGDESVARAPPSRHLETGMTGFLLSVNNKEDRQGLVECYRLLNEAHERLHGKSDDDEKKTGSGDEEEEEEDDDDDDIEASLRKEAANDSSGGVGKFIFNGVKTGVSNCVFVLNCSEKSSSAALVHEVFRHVLEIGQACCRRILRFQPVLATCRPDKANLRGLVKQAWAEFWSPECLEAGEGNVKPLCLLCPKVPPQRVAFIGKQPPENRKHAYMVNFRARNYDKMAKQEAVMTVIGAMQEVAPDWSPVCAGADLVISVDVFRNVLCLSFLERFSDFAKYNIRELSVP